MANLHVGDVGVTLRLTVMQDGAAKDISTATTKQIRIRKPSGELVTSAASFTTTGADGKLQVTTGSTDLDEEGVYSAYAYIVISPWSGITSALKFTVLAAGE